MHVTNGLQKATRFRDRLIFAIITLRKRRLQFGFLDFPSTLFSANDDDENCRFQLTFA